MKRLIVVTGGGFSGIGKGVLTASLAVLAEARGYTTEPIKFDGYFNRDVGSMNPYGRDIHTVFDDEEVFVTYDGFECDTDIGVYERFLGRSISGRNNITNGKVYGKLMGLEDSPSYRLGEVLKVRPHLHQVYEELIEDALQDADIGIIEVGGTIGDAESRDFLDYLQSRRLKERDSVFHAHLAFIPMEDRPNPTKGEVHIEKSYHLKPAKQSVGAATEKGLHPDAIFYRSRFQLPVTGKSRLSEATLIPASSIIEDPDLSSIYLLPDAMVQEMGALFDEFIPERGLNQKRIVALRKYGKGVSEASEKVRVGLLGDPLSYDSGLSLLEALYHACVGFGYIPAVKALKGRGCMNDVDGILVTEGKGMQTTENLVQAARQMQLPILGISSGFFHCTEEIGGIKESSETTEITLGEVDSEIKEGTRLSSIYRSLTLTERQRSNRKVTSSARKKIESEGGVFSAESRGEPVVIEDSNSDFFIGTKNHPEYSSRPGTPNKLIEEFVRQMIG